MFLKLSTNKVSAYFCKKFDPLDVILNVKIGTELFFRPKLENEFPSCDKYPSRSNIFPEMIHQLYYSDNPLTISLFPVLCFLKIQPHHYFNILYTKIIWIGKK